jgi:hypothetical protein
MVRALRSYAAATASALAVAPLLWGALFCAATAQAEPAIAFTASPEALADPDFLRGFARSCGASLSAAQCSCVLAAARAAPQPLVIDEPLLLGWVRACAVPAQASPTYTSDALAAAEARATPQPELWTPPPQPAPRAQGWWVRAQAVSAGPAATSKAAEGARAVRCEPGVSACSGAWAAAWVAAASLNLTPWACAVEVGGDLSMRDTRDLMTALITLWTDPAATVVTISNDAASRARDVVTARAAFTHVIPLPPAALAAAWTAPAPDDSMSAPVVALDRDALRRLQRQLAFAGAAAPAPQRPPSAWGWLLDAHGLAGAGALPIGEALRLSRDLNQLAASLEPLLRDDAPMAQRHIWLAWASAPKVASSPAWSVVRLRANWATRAASPRRALTQWARAAAWARALGSVAER